MELGRWLIHACTISIVLLLHINASLSLGHHHANVMARWIERERDALLAIKGDLVDEYNLLSSWESGDCCGWERVHCDPHTGHVIQLHLGGVFLLSQRQYILKKFGGQVSPKIIELQYLEYLDLSLNSFNATQIPVLICSLSSLRHLDLQSNSLNGSKIPKLIGNLTNLRYLDLSQNSLGDETPVPYHQLGNLTHLQYLNLGSNYYTHAVENLNWLPHLSSLKYLDLSRTNMSKASNWLDTINKLPNLRNLTLQYCDLPPPILSTLSHINSSDSLVSVDLSGNVVTSSIFKWLCNYNTTLADLDLYSTQLSGLIPDVFRNMRSLKILNLFSNQLSGSIPDVFKNMNSLQFLLLSFNQLSGLNPNAFANMSSLAYLDLSFNQLSGLNPNVFANISSLAEIDLSSNQLIGLNPNAFTNMSSLASLYLSNNPFEGGFPASITQLCSLQYLSISGCNLTGQLSESIQRWSACPQNSLQGLDLSNNDLAGSFPNFTNFLSLERLDLSENKLSGMVLDSIGKLSSLTWLSVNENQLRWTIPESIGELSRLQYLGLSGNLLSGGIPESIGKLSSLAYLDLSKNQLSGRIPKQIGKMSSLDWLDLSTNWLWGRLPQSIGQLSNLSYLNLSMNHFEGEISKTHFSKLFILDSLDLSDNSRLEFNVTTDWIPPFYLSYMSLRSCKVGPNFPKWLQTQKHVLDLDMSYTDISDVFPSWFWSVFGDTPIIDFSNNKISGTLGSSEIVSFSGFEVRLSSNQLGGLVPSFLSNASYLDLSDNKFLEMTSFLCSSNIKVSKFVDLSKNHISGEVPDCWIHWVNLELLDLSFNAFSGKIPPSIGSLIGMKTLKLRSNKLVGELPSPLKNCTSLNVIDLGNNLLSSSVPDWLAVGIPNLVILMLQANQFSGSLPSQLCHLAHLQILDVSMNQISGTVPNCLNNLTSLAQEGNSNLTIRHSFNISDEAEPPMTSLYYEDDATFMWKGTLASYKSTLGLVKRIDLSSNRLTGEIPTEITHLVGLVSLNLSRNSLSGQIPLDIGKLKSLDSLDLSRNKINGGIPKSLVHIDRLSAMDLSYNNLSGEIPTGTQLEGFDPSSYVGNPQLCGFPLENICNPEGTGRPTISSGQEDVDELISQGFYISLGLGFAFGFWGICGSLIFKKSWRYAYYNFLNASNDWFYVKIVLMRQQLKDFLNRHQS